MEIQRSGRPPVDSRLVLPAIGRVRVVSNSDPSLVALETATGARLKIGEKALRQLIEIGRLAA